MRNFLALTIWAGLVAANLSAGTVSYDFSILPYAPPADEPAGSSMVQLTYLLSNFSFAANQAIDIQFDPTLYDSLSNAQAPSGFDLTILQPNNPPGEGGDFIALATTNGPFSGSFSIDAVYLGSGTPPAQSYTIDQFAPDGSFVSQVTSGETTPTGTAVPEPGTFWLGGIGLLFSVCCWRVRRQLRRNV